MIKRYLILTSLLALAILLSACGPSTLTLQQQAPQRTLTVTGTGMVTLTPDIAYIYIGVHTENVSATEAVAENNTNAQAVMTAIRGLGVEAADIKTTNFSIYPQQQYDDQGKVTGVLYMVDNTIYVTMRNLDKLGDLLDAAITAGANNINSIQFDVADKTVAISQARQAAVENARMQADELTSAAGVILGNVQTISYYDTSPAPYYEYGKGGGTMSASVPVSGGSFQLTTTVTIVYELK